MGKIKSFCSDWKYMISSENKQSRGFYICVTIAIVVLVLASIASLGIYTYCLITFGENILKLLIGGIAGVFITVGILVWLALT